MRVALVSAHYPPNFVSGGTLVPYHMADGLARRGHEVAVFAGRLDPAETALTTWTEGETVPVTWVNVTPFTSWDDIRNYDNPAVADEFRRWLSDVRPDVVHFHSLQTLGASLVSVASDAGCSTVITMHDFWWICSRQFLVDTTMRPCSLVVDAGTCQCQSGRKALDERAALLAPHLAVADLILAPSQVTADVLEANGVPGNRLRVNENGMRLDPPRTDRISSRTVRFRYTGGADPMKGAGVLLDAIRMLEHQESWRLTVHLADDAQGPLAGLSTEGSIVRASPYRPEDLDAVLADTDVLLLPSVMRETHSIVTREALLRGVPVVSSDSLGPEQVIEHGVNGLIVPTGDHEALADAIRSLVADRSLLDRLTEGTTNITVRDIDEQVEELDDYLRALPTGGTAISSTTPTSTSVLFIVGIDGAPLRYRAQFPAEALGLAGATTTILHYSDHRVEAAIDSTDIVVVYRVPATPRILRLIDRTRQRGVRVVFDVDDLIVDPEVRDQIPALRLLPEDEASLWMEGVHRYRTTLEHCDAFVGSTTPLVDAVAAATGIPSYLKRNAYGLHLARLSDDALRAPREPGPVRIGYLSGTNTHDEDLRSVVAALCSILDRHPDTEVWLGGHLPTDPAFEPYADRVVRVPFRPWTELPALLRQIDINLAPLADLGTFNQAKSAIKWLEAALVATPTVASASVPFQTAIDHGINGMLVAEPAAWESTISELVTDSVKRRAIGSAARRSALLDWSPHREGAAYLRTLKSIESRPSGSSWSDVTVDEPASPSSVALTPYPPPMNHVRHHPKPVDGDPGLIRKIVWSMSNESPKVVLRRAISRLRRQ